MTLQTIQEMRELEGKATPGEWKIKKQWVPSNQWEPEERAVVDTPSGSRCVFNGSYPEDMYFLAHLRNNAKALLDMAEECLRLREEVRELKKTAILVEGSNGAKGYLQLHEVVDPDASDNGDMKITVL